MGIIKKLKKKLNPKFMNTEFTWHQIEAAIKEIESNPQKSGGRY